MSDEPARSRDARRRRSLGRTLQLVAVLGVVVGVLAAVLGWRVAGALDEVAVESTAVTADALASLGDTLDVAAALVVSVDDTLTALEGALGTTTTSLVEGGEALASVATLAEEAAPALESATATLRTLEGVGDTIDSTLRGLSALPFGPEYDPDRSFGETIRALADDLEPLGESFAATAADLDQVAADGEVLEQDLRSLTVAVGEGAEQLDTSAAIIADYRETARRARELAAVAGQDLDRDLALLRLLIVLGGLVFAAGQVVPWTVARPMLAG